jgi:hypothetical protein
VKQIHAKIITTVSHKSETLGNIHLPLAAVVIALRNDKHVEVILLHFSVMIPIFRFCGPTDGMSALYSHAITDRLNEEFPQHWI